MTPGPSETDRRSVSRHRGVFDVHTTTIGDELMQKQCWVLAATALASLLVTLDPLVVTTALRTQ